MSHNTLKRQGAVTFRNGRKLSNRNIKKAMFYASVVALPILQFSIFYIVVNFRSFLFAFQNYDIIDGYSFIGFDNFVNFFKNLKTDPKLIYSLKNSAILYVCTLVIGSGGAVLFSNYIYKKYRGHSLFRITLFLPNIVSGIVLIIAYKFLIDDGVPEIIKFFGGDRIIPPLANPKYRFPLVLAFTIWFSFGTQVLMYTSTMSGISPEIVESAQLDGVTPMRELLHITIPMIFPTFVTFITVGVAGFFTNQMGLFSFFGANADPQIYTFGYYLYVNSWLASMQYDYGAFTELSAMGLIMTMVAVPLTLGIKKVLEKFGPSC